MTLAAHWVERYPLEVVDKVFLIEVTLLLQTIIPIVSELDNTVRKRYRRKSLYMQLDVSYRTAADVIAKSNQVHCMWLIKH